MEAERRGQAGAMKYAAAYLALSLAHFWFNPGWIAGMPRRPLWRRVVRAVTWQVVAAWRVLCGVAWLGWPR